METKAVRLPDALTRAVDRIADERKIKRSEVIRDALERYCAEYETGRKRGRVELLDRLVTYRGSGRGDLATRSEEHLKRIFDERRRRRSR